MTAHGPVESPPRNILYLDVLQTLKRLAPFTNNDITPTPGTWPTTRQIANAHGISIYKARLVLLELVRQGHVIVSDGAINNSLRWYPLR